MSDKVNEQTELEADDQPVSTWQHIVEAQEQRRVDLANRLFGSDKTENDDE